MIRGLRRMNNDKYSPLFTYLKNHDGNHIRLTFAQIEAIISDNLPKSASKHRTFWANGGHNHASVLEC